MSNPIIELPSQAEQMAFNLRRWIEIIDDRELARFEGRVETDRHGHVIMSPPASFEHGRYQFRLPRLIETLLPDGECLTECPISTPDGVRVADAAWISTERLAEVSGSVCLTIAPEICVEIISPSNTHRELAEKKALYFAAGAKEVWFCDGAGTMTFFADASSPAEAASPLCPAFPRKIEL